MEVTGGAPLWWMGVHMGVAARVPAQGQWRVSCVGVVPGFLLRWVAGSPARMLIPVVLLGHPGSCTVAEAWTPVRTAAMVPAQEQLWGSSITRRVEPHRTSPPFSRVLRLLLDRFFEARGLHFPPTAPEGQRHG